MPKINGQFAAGESLETGRDYVNGDTGGPGLNQVLNKVNVAPITWATVAEAEAASYTEPESVVVTETGRTYTYSASSEAARDGIRFLAPAGGGRLLMTTPVMTDAEVAAATRVASPSQSGLMSIAQASQIQLLGGFMGNLTTSQRNSISSPSAGMWIFNTEFDYRIERYNGYVWLANGHVMLTNNTGSTSIEGYSVKLYTSGDFGIYYPEYDGDEWVIGVVVTGGVSNGGKVAVARTGIANVYISGSYSITPEHFFSALSGGKNRGYNSTGAGRYGRSLETRSAGSDYLVKGLLGSAGEIY